MLDRIIPCPSNYFVSYTKNARMVVVETYELPQGKLTIAFSDGKLSIGLLELNPKQELPKHNRPVTEELLQIQGTCTMKLFEEDKQVDKIILEEGNKLTIPKNQFHIHSNPNNSVSVTLWKFEGGITEIISKIRKDFKRIS